MGKYRAIDADGHFTEPSSIWPQYLAKKYHPMAPRRVRDNRGRSRIMIGGRMLPYVPMPPVSESEPARRGGYDPHARLSDMDAEGIEAMITYPTTGLMFFGLENLELTVALCQAFNNWAHDFCAVNPKRLISPAILPQMDVGESMAELRRGIAELGLRALSCGSIPSVAARWTVPPSSRCGACSRNSTSRSSCTRATPRICRRSE